MTPNQRAHVSIAVAFTAIAGLAAAGLYAAPERGYKWILAVAMMALLWLIATVVGRAAVARGQADAFSRWLGPSAVWAGVLLAIPQAEALAQVLGYGDVLSGDRLRGIAFGLAMAAFGNLMPKIVGPLPARRCSAAEMASVQRFAGWTFTLMGLGYAAAWAFAPGGWADGVSTALCAGSVVLVLGRLFLAFRPRAAGPS